LAAFAVNAKGALRFATSREDLFVAMLKIAMPPKAVAFGSRQSARA
jgi:hypothetical protein